MFFQEKRWNGDLNASNAHDILFWWGWDLETTSGTSGDTFWTIILDKIAFENKNIEVLGVSSQKWGFFHGKNAKKWLSGDFGVEKWNFLKSYKTSPGTSGWYSKAFLRCFRTCRTSNLEIFGRVISIEKCWKKAIRYRFGVPKHIFYKFSIFDVGVPTKYLAIFFVDSETPKIVKRI